MSNLIKNPFNLFDQINYHDGTITIDFGKRSLLQKDNKELIYFYKGFEEFCMKEANNSFLELLGGLIDEDYEVELDDIGAPRRERAVEDRRRNRNRDFSPMGR